MHGINIDGLAETVQPQTAQPQTAQPQTAQPQTAQSQADSLIAAEIARQDRMWGAENERADISKGQLFDAAFAQMDLLALKADGYEAAEALEISKGTFPADWGGFRDYGSDIANLAVVAAYIRQEIVRRIRAGGSTFRAPRDPGTQPYDVNTTPAVIEP